VSSPMKFSPHPSPPPEAEPTSQTFLSVVRAANRRVLRGLFMLAIPWFPIYLAAADPNTDLSNAIAKRELPAIVKAIDRGADVNLSAPDGRTALMIAAGEGDLGLVERLIQAGANVNARNDRGGTALMYAALEDSPKVLELLLARGAKPDLQAKNGWTALMLAAARGHTECATRLLAHRANPNLADVYGWTPLMRAVHEQRAGVADALLANRAIDLNAVDEAGNTALHHAAVEGALDLAQKLLAAGADPKRKDREGRIPAEVARLAGHADVAALIERAIGKAAPRARRPSVQ